MLDRENGIYKQTTAVEQNIDDYGWKSSVIRSVVRSQYSLSSQDSGKEHYRSEAPAACHDNIDNGIL